MINFFHENSKKTANIKNRKFWLAQIIFLEKREKGNINYIICDDEYLLNINKQYLNHDYYTDIITFDYTEENVISGDIFISETRVLENSFQLGTDYQEEFNRVLAHGILHLCGYKDSSKEEKKCMREKEDFYLEVFKKMFHVKQLRKNDL